MSDGVPDAGSDQRSARDERLERDVGIKLLAAGVLSGEELRRRFLKEALALAKRNQRTFLFKTVLDWLDQYLGPVQSSFQ